jgi:hypothetical protein
VLDIEYQNQILIGVIRSDWFARIIEQHPIFTWAKTQNILIDKMALAQHYGLRTGLLDLTQDINVAAFFACGKYVDNQLVPMSDGIGIIYYISVSDYSGSPGSFKRPIVPISHQPFPRPTEQWGWTMETFLGDDFENFPYVRSLQFKHNFNSSTRILERYDYGSKLFPPDPLAEIADEINQSQTLPRQIAIEVLKDFAADPQGIIAKDINENLAELSLQTNILFSEESPNFFNENRLNLAEKIWDSKKESFFKGVTFRLIRTTK